MDQENCTTRQGDGDRCGEPAVMCDLTGSGENRRCQACADYLRSWELRPLNPPIEIVG